jgi:hypothetical protein
LSQRLREASFDVVAGRSIVAPLIIDGLPARIHALGMQWERKREFHLTVVPRAFVEAAASDQRTEAELWDTVTVALSGRTVGPITTRDDVRRVSQAGDDLQTLIVMVDAPGLAPLYDDLAAAIDAPLRPPPAHVTLYSTDPAEGIGIEDETQLGERAPPLSEAEQSEVRRAMSFDTVFADDSNQSADAEWLSSPIYIEALEYAAAVHRGQRHRGRDVPYLAHVVAVAALVAEDGGGEIEGIAALLHDAAEDHGGERRLADIEHRFGVDVARIVRALSDTLDPQAARQEPWRVRKERYLATLRRETDARILRIANADKLHNARTLLAEERLRGEELWTRHARRKQDELWYYRALAEIFAERRPATSLLVSELAAAVVQLETS